MIVLQFFRLIKLLYLTHAFYGLEPVSYTHLDVYKRQKETHKDGYIINSELNQNDLAY